MRFEERWQKLLPIFPKKRVEAVLISSLPNVQYLSGFSGSFGHLLITLERRSFFTDFRYAEEANKLIKHYEIVIIRNSFLKEFSRFLRENDLKSLGIEANSLSVGFYQKLKQNTKCMLVPVDLSFLRVIKEESEVLAIKKAVKIAVKAFLKLLPLIKPGVKERDLAVELEYLLRKGGSEELPFLPIVASGPNSSQPHARAGLRRIRTGDLIKIDWGARCSGYCSDLTRMVHLGPVSKEENQALRLVAKAREFVVSSLSDSLKAKEADRIVRNFFKKKGVLSLFGHGLGHGIGLEVHEAPTLNQESQDVLCEGMVFTIEPGLYYPKRFGIRLEDDVWLHHGQAKVLSSSLSLDWFVV